MFYQNFSRFEEIAFDLNTYYHLERVFHTSREEYILLLCEQGKIEDCAAALSLVQNHLPIPYPEPAKNDAAGWDEYAYLTLQPFPRHFRQDWERVFPEKPILFQEWPDEEREA